ncbi:hypothetical protein TNCV_4167911 [Trichonephila clavipes]|nr:hypothetical protein TNCV_4167911 [Trichonephila clavipes]
MLISLWNSTKASFLDPSPMLCSNVTGQVIEYLRSECTQLMRNRTIYQFQKFLPSFVCLRNSSHDHASWPQPPNQSEDDLMLHVTGIIYGTHSPSELLSSIWKVKIA